MKPVQSAGGEYSTRIRRAEHLRAEHPFAHEVLTFYLKIAKFQAELHAHTLRESRSKPAMGNALGGELNAAPLLPHFLAMLELVEQAGPEPVRETALQLERRGRGEWEKALKDFWERRGRLNDETADEPLNDFLLRAFLQPYAELLGAQTGAPPVTTDHRDCPRCEARPLLGVLRPEGEGGKRRLMCSFCLQEWDFRRIYCAACGEAAEQKLPVYVAEGFPHIRVEACETCKSYLRTIDLTKDGNAVPLVDDLAAIPLSLWAEEHGYQRIHGNLLGT